ncbi:hypothetical protein [Flavobacterium psychrophilum]|uniref:Uncharacterized protein n=1 Tax=Flavobacterium psychrophilum TaxID=96345 RepID=A0A7U2NEE2_FLAPS|nr:hypothetical protein [Flavobacterium psychrophilum]QRE03504.1 hypothetical protein H0H26_11525 [Flavobacterium psychrophilum]
MKKEYLKQLSQCLLMLAIAIVFMCAFHKCNRSTTTQKVTTKEVSGSFKLKDVVNKPIYTVVKTKKQPYINSEQLKNDEFLQNEIDRLLAENKKQLNEFANANDSLQLLLYEKSIQLNEFSQTFDDDKIKIDVSGLSQGTIKNIKANYTIKSQKIDVVVKKERIFALKTGLEYGNSIELNKGLFKANLEFENRKENSYSIGYDTDKRIWVGYKMTIFDIKR